VANLARFRFAEQHWVHAALMVPVFVLLFFFQGLYDRQNLLGGTMEYRGVVRAGAFGLVALILMTFMVRRQPSREWVLFSCGLTASVVGTTRFGLRRLAHALRHRGLLVTRALLVGADAQSVAVARQLTQAGSGFEVVGALDDYAAPGTLVGGALKVLGTPAALSQVAARTESHEAIVVPQALPWETLQSVLSEAVAGGTGMRVHISAGYYDLLTSGVRLSERNHVPLLTVEKAVLTPAEAVVKRGVDCLLAVLLLTMSAPLLLCLAARLRVEDGTSVLERRRVLGRHGDAFNLLSLKSSGWPGSEFMRKMPGLLNVLSGQLSIVGPKPLNNDSGRQHSWPYSRTLTIRPGLTGLWRQAHDPTEQAVLDLYYIRNYSVWLDLQVLFQRLKSRVHRRSPALHAELFAAD
jgi:lipopolysaccharide/colanic/teichoic acid biosynthesis glycosyltransferase